VRQFRVLLSAGNNTRRTSRGNTKSDVIGRWESGEECHWCSQLGAQVGVGKESEVVRHCSRQCSRGESTRESAVVLALGD
jgi:hypothetical protein